jgi:cytochrome c2
LWAPLEGRLLHYSFGRCTMLLALRETINGQAQGAVMELPVQFESGAMRGRFHPRDEQLYVTGLKGWVSSAAQDGCFQRVRYTGKPLHLPTDIKTFANGIKLTFSEPLDPASASDPDNYFLEQWNYHWSADYGSADYKPSDPKQEGHEPVEVRSAMVLDGGRSVFLEIDPLVPVMQVAVQFKLRAAGGAPVEHTVYHTINRVPKERTEVPASARVVRRAQLDQETVARLEPGLLLTTYELRPDDVSEDKRPIRLAALHVEPGERAAARVALGSWDADLTGYLHLPIKEECWFSYEGTGETYLTINGAEFALKNSTVANGKELGCDAEPVALHKGYNRISVRYRPPANGPAEFRLLWSSTSFVAEPIPPTVLFHDRGDQQLELSTRWREGRELFASLGCASCHTVEGMRLDKPAMPEALRRSPSLEKVAERLQPQWLVAWIEDPKSCRADATMPKMLSGADHRQQAADVVAYLTAGSKAELKAYKRAADDAMIDRGEQLYETLGCLACHRLGRDSATDDRITLALVGSKYVAGALEDYLKKPQRFHTGTRMPDFKLSAEEAAAVAAFLLAKSSPLPQQPASKVAGNADRGRTIYQTVGCRNCHEQGIGDTNAKIAATPIAIENLSDGCLAEMGAARHVAPDYAPADYALAASQRDALRVFLRRPADSLSADPPAEAAARLVKTLRCTACHARDGKPSRLTVLLPEEGTTGLPPESIPQLTWVGEKLKPAWTRELLSGERENRSRPWLRARMPAFPAYAQALSIGLAAEHGIGSDATPHESLDPQTIELGRQLTLKDRGLDCRQCHTLDRSAVLQEHNAQGIGLLEVKDRMRYDFYRRWVLDPLRIDPGTKMPKFAADGQTTTTKHILDGDARAQFDALWRYIQSLEPSDATSPPALPATSH